MLAENKTLNNTQVSESIKRISSIAFFNSVSKFSGKSTVDLKLEAKSDKLASSTPEISSIFAVSSNEVKPLLTIYFTTSL